MCVSGCACAAMHCAPLLSHHHLQSASKHTPCHCFAALVASVGIPVVFEQLSTQHCVGCVAVVLCKSWLGSGESSFAAAESELVNHHINHTTTPINTTARPFNRARTGALLNAGQILGWQPLTPQLSLAEHNSNTKECGVTT